MLGSMDLAEETRANNARYTDGDSTAFHRSK